MVDSFVSFFVTLFSITLIVTISLLACRTSSAGVLSIPSRFSLYNESA